MAKKMLIDATHAEETRVVVVDGTKVEEFDFESENKRQLAGNIYLAKVTRVEPSLQAAFVDYGGNRHGFLAFSEIHPDYYQIPVADREALLAEEKAMAEAQAEEEEEGRKKPSRRRRSRGRGRAAKAESGDAVVKEEISSLDVVDLGEGDEDLEGSSPMVLVGETPVETPAADSEDEAGEAETPEAEDIAQAEQDSGSGGEKAEVSEEEESEADETADDGIEAVADDDSPEEIRPPRKPRPRRYKIQEVIKVRQIMLVQVVKEERGNKGRGADDLSFACRALLRADAQYCARGGHFTQDHQPRRSQEAQADRERDQGSRGGWADHPHGGGQAHQGRDQARLRISPAALGADPRVDAEIHRSGENLRGGQPHQALNPRSLQPRD